MPGPWWPVTLHAVDFGDVDRVAGRVLGDVAAFGQIAVAALERADPQGEAFRAQVLEHREDAAVDLARFDVFATALVDVEAVVVQHPLRQRFLGEQQDPGAAQLRVEGVLALGAVDRGRFEQLPAVEDRLRVDPRRAFARRADREVDVRVGAFAALGDVGEDGAGDHLRADPDRAVAGRPFRELLRPSLRPSVPCRRSCPARCGRARSRGRSSWLSTGICFSLPFVVTTVRLSRTSLPRPA